MAKSNLTTRLAKELRRSPKKSAVLALMLVVALWFWAPLAWKWMAPQSSDAATSAPAPPTDAGIVASGAAVVATTSAPATPALEWRELATVLENDPLLTSARVHEKLADPFAKPIVKTQSTTNEGETEEQPATASVQAKATPEQLGLTLASTIAGGRRAVATINGESCRVGDVIVVRGGGVDFEFTIIGIAASEVTLAAGAETHILTTKRPDSTMRLSQAGATRGGALPTSTRQRVVIGARLGE